MNNIQDLITGNTAVDYINVTTIIVNSVALFASAILIIFFILNIILKVLYKNLQDIINWKANSDFIIFPCNKTITLNDFYKDIELLNNKLKIDNEFNEFKKEMQTHEKKLLIFKKILQILWTIINYSIRYKKFVRLINNLRILYCCFSTNKYDNGYYLMFNNYYFQIKIIDTNYFQIITTLDNKQNLVFNLKTNHHNCYKLCPNQSFNELQQSFINDFLNYFNDRNKLIYHKLKKNLLIFEKTNWINVDDAVVENIKAFHRYKHLDKKYWIIKLKTKFLNKY